MVWQVFTVALFTAWVSLGALLGSWLGPVRHYFDAGAFHVQSLYDSHLGWVAPQDGADKQPRLQRLH